MRALIYSLVCSLGALALFACEGEGPPTSPNCPKDGSVVVSGTVVFTPPAVPLDPDHPTISIKGTALHDAGLAIRHVYVGGVEAAKKAFNFGKWEVTLDYSDLLDLEVIEATDDREFDRVRVAAVAVDVCGLATEFDDFTLPVDLTPNIRLDTLAIKVTPPLGRAYLPADGSQPGTVEVMGQPGKSSGTTVNLHATSGSFMTTGNIASVTLAAAIGADMATGTLLYYGGQPGAPGIPGTVLFTANAEGLVATTSVKVAGPPTILPSAATLVPGTTLQLTVMSDGKVARCGATPRPGVSITSGSEDITLTQAANDSNGDGHPDIDIEVADEIEAAVSLTIYCSDDYQQESSAVYQVKLPEPPPEPDPGR